MQTDRRSDRGQPLELDDWIGGTDPTYARGRSGGDGAASDFPAACGAVGEISGLKDLQLIDRRDGVVRGAWEAGDDVLVLVRSHRQRCVDDGLIDPGVEAVDRSIESVDDLLGVERRPDEYRCAV